MSDKLSVVGKGVPVKDARSKVTGSLGFAVDLGIHRMAYGKILRSPYAHARVQSIDTSKAEALPGVIAVLTHEDTPRNNWEAPWFNYRGMVLDGVARFVGDEVAAVAAETEEIAQHAVELIEVEWEVLPHVFDMQQATRSDAPQVREEGNARPPFLVQWGDIKIGKAESDFVVDCDINFMSQQYASLGRNASIAEWDNGRVTLWTASQTPSEVKDGIQEVLGIPQSKIRVKSLPSGSSFGLWWANNFMMVTVLLARKAGRAVKIELSNEECMATVKRRHEEYSVGQMGCSKEGRLTFLNMDHMIDNGAYGYKNDVGYASLELWNGIENARCQVTGVNTNRLTAGCFRGVGDCTMSTAFERMADQLAEKTGFDPIEFRIKNQISEGDEFKSLKDYYDHIMLQTNGNPLANVDPELHHKWPKLFHLSSGSSIPMLKDGAEKFRWDERFKGWGKPFSTKAGKHRAVGVGTGSHTCGVEEEGNVDAIVRINPDGSALVFCSAGRQGQGSETTQAQVAAEALGLSLDMVEVETGDTDACPWAHGSIASNTMFRTGWATREAAVDARRQILELAARECFDGIEAGSLDIVDGIICSKAEDASSVAVSEVMSLLRSDAWSQMSSITGSSRQPMPPTITFARQFAVHFIEVEVDTDTGQIKILDYLALQDSGTVVNPQILKNQVIGGAICGLGYALYEELKFSPDTGEALNANLLDYKLLRTGDFPAHAKVVFHESPDPVGPYGARGAGESPMAAAIPAVAQAVYNAIGVWVDIPMTPENVIRALGKI